MKFMENSNNNWLGFSLSPQMNPMEVSSDSDQHQTEQSPPPSVPNAVQNCNFFLSPTQLNPHGLCYEGENTAELYSHLSFMPIKSDGSLCLMEALTRSSQNQGMVPSPSPKLEDFLGATGCGPNTNTGAHHQYVNNERESTATTMYYDQSHEPLELLQQPFNFQPLQLQDMYHHHHHHHHHHHDNPPLEEEEEPMGGDDDGFSSLKNWVSIDGASSLGYGDLHSLSLSMSPGSQSSTVTAPQQQHHHVISNDCMALEVGGKKRGSGKVGGSQKQPVHRKSIDTFGQRTSQYRGVTRHRWTGRYEAHLWDNSCKKEGQTRKGRQVYLGGYDMEDKAARSYDLAALKYWGPSTHINFPLENYHEELQEMKNMSRQEYVAHLRRKSSGFSRGASMYRGVTRHHQHGRWQARIGRVAGNKDLYLGTFSTQEDAAEAYDVAAIKFRGASAVTNFDITRYDVEKIIASPTLLSGENARKTKPVQSQNTNKEMNLIQGNNNMTASDWKVVLYESPAQNQNHQQEPVSVAFHGTHMSNPSSLVTSLNSSREGSPNRTGSGLSLVYSKAEPGFNVGSGSIGSWIPSAHDLRPTAISMAQMPLFAAWSDV